MEGGGEGRPIESRIPREGEWNCIGWGNRELSGVVKKACILTGLWATQVYLFVKTQ